MIDLNTSDNGIDNLFVGFFPAWNFKLNFTVCVCVHKPDFSLLHQFQFAHKQQKFNLKCWPPVERHPVNGFHVIQRTFDIGYCFQFLWRHCTEFFHTNPYWCHSTVKFAMAWFCCVCSHIMNGLCVVIVIVFASSFIFFFCLCFFLCRRHQHTWQVVYVCLYYMYACVHETEHTCESWTFSSCYYHRAIYLAWFSPYYSVYYNHNNTWRRV